MSYLDALVALARTVTWKAVLYLDYCTLTHGQSPCAATGEPCCYYTYCTCQDPDHFTRGRREYAFSPVEGQRIKDCLPYLLDVRSVPTEIRPEDNVTRRARITLEFLDDAPLALANPDKSVSNLESAGGFFQNLLARNPNLIGRTAELWQGFAGIPASEFKLSFKGVIDKVEREEGRFKVQVKDQLKLLDKKIPRKQSSDNLLTAVYNGGSTMSVADASEFEAPGAVKVEDEYVTFAGAEEGALTGCSPGAFGSAAVSHPVGGKVKQVIAFAEPASGEGLPPDEIFLSLLCDHGGIDPLDVAVVDRGAHLTSGLLKGDLTISVDHPEVFPETGVIRINDELIRYRGVSGSALQGVKRGAYGTAPAGHNLGEDVLVTRFSDELGRWMSGALYRRFVEQSISIKDLVNQLRAQALLHVWQTEDSTISAKSVAPPFYTDTPKEIDDDTGIINGSLAWDPGHELMSTRVVVYYDPEKPDSGENPESYQGLLALVDYEIESPDYYDGARPKEIFGTWIYREHEALLLASRYLIRYRNGAGQLKFALELKDDDLEVGDFVRVTSSELCLPSGAVRERALFEVIKKCRTSDNRLEFTAIDTRLDRRYPVIAPASLTVDYDEASEEDREKYGWIGDENNRVGADLDPGYYIY